MIWKVEELNPIRMIGFSTPIYRKETPIKYYSLLHVGAETMDMPFAARKTLKHKNS